MNMGHRNLRIECALSLLVLLAVAGCMEVHSAFGPGVNYRRFGSTFAWLPEGESKAEYGHAANPTANEFIHDAITEGFQGRGYRFEEAATPDFLIDYQVVRRTKGGLAHASWSATREEGSLILEVFDAQTRKPVWRGYTTARLDESAEPAQQRRRMVEAVRAILAQFPREGTQ